MVWTDVRRGLHARLFPRAPPRRELSQSDRATSTRSIDRLLGYWYARRCPSDVCARLRQARVFGASAGDLRDLARWFVISWRHNRHGRWMCPLCLSRKSCAARDYGPRCGLWRARTLLRTVRQFHQRRALWSARERPMGDGLPDRSDRTPPPSIAALRGTRRGSLSRTSA